MRTGRKTLIAAGLLIGGVVLGVLGLSRPVYQPSGRVPVTSVWSTSAIANPSAIAAVTRAMATEYPLELEVRTREEIDELVEALGALP